MPNINDLLGELLTATVDQDTAKTRVTLLRTRLEEEARRRTLEDGAAPTWKATTGTVVWSDLGEWRPTVADPAAFGSFVAQRHPDHATANITIPAEHLEAALEAIAFAGAPPSATRATITIEPKFEEAYLDGLAIDVTEGPGAHPGTTHREFTIVNKAGELVDGLTGERSAGKLTVTLDKTVKAAAKAAAIEAAAAFTEDADEPPLDVRRVTELELLPATTLAKVAKALELKTSGTKSDLADAIARAELRTGVHVGAAFLTEVDPDYAPLTEAGVAPTIEHGDPLTPHDVGRIDPDTATPAELVAQHEADRAAAIAAVTAEPADDATVAALEAAANRETLRALARHRGIAPGGTKRDVAEALAADGATAADLEALHSA